MILYRNGKILFFYLKYNFSKWKYTQAVCLCFLAELLEISVYDLDENNLTMIIYIYIIRLSFRTHLHQTISVIRLLLLYFHCNLKIKKM